MASNLTERETGLADGTQWACDHLNFVGHEKSAAYNALKAAGRSLDYINGWWDGATRDAADAADYAAHQAWAAEKGRKALTQAEWTEGNS